jgi:hypothetical protein
MEQEAKHDDHTILRNTNAADEQLSNYLGLCFLSHPAISLSKMAGIF